MNSNILPYSVLSYVLGSDELIEPTLTALSEPLPVTYPLKAAPAAGQCPALSARLSRCALKDYAPSKGGLCEACGFA